MARPAGSEFDNLARAEALLELRRPEEAIPLLAAAAASEPSSHLPRCLLAQAYLALGRWQDALSHAEGAIAVEPADDWPHRLRASALLGLRRGKAARAAAHVAVRLAPGSATTHAVLGEALLACGRGAAAEERARHVVGLDPKWSGGHDLLGRSALGRGRLRQAEEHFRDALRLDPEDPVLLNNLGRVLDQQGRRREAINLYAAASVADPHESAARYNATLAAARRPIVGILGLVVILAVWVPGRIWALAWPPSVAGVTAAVALVGLAFALFTRRNGREVHEYPKVAPELLRSLRRLATRQEPRSGGSLGAGDEPIATPLIIAVLGLGLAAMCVYGVFSTSPLNTAPTYQWLLLMTVGLAQGGFGVAAVLRRRPGSLGRHSFWGRRGSG